MQNYNKIRSDKRKSYIIFVFSIKYVMTEKIIKRVPYGTSNFGKLISENYAYVDKTRFIELLENSRHYLYREKRL
jgi:hypothetical protein